MTCLDCQGKGEVEKRVTCKMCGGSGKVEIIDDYGKRINIKCYPCRGTGKVREADTCNMCGGSGECEGHLDHGYPYPWVTLIDDERSHQFNRAWRQVCALEERAKASASVEAFDDYLSAESDLRALITRWEAWDTCLAHLSALLEDFYANRATNAARLMVKRLQPGTYRLEPGFSCVVVEMPAHLKASYLLLGQAEMQDFTMYLKQRFFA